MIEQHRTMELPGEGIVRDPGPKKEHEEFPRYMTHPQYRPGKPDKEIKVFNDAGQEVGKRYMGGESIRFPPVLVRTAASRDEHLSFGYVDQGKSDPAAFERLVASAQPVPENYVPIEYPKYCFGKIVNDRAEEEERLIELNINPDGSPREASSEVAASEPALDTEVATLEVWPAVPGAAAGAETAASDEDDIGALEAKLAEIRARKARAAELRAEIGAELAEEAEPVAEPVELVAAEPTPPAKPSRSEAIKAGLARKKAAKAQEGDKAA